ncbi:hypothetical protein RvY_04566 [Ramazzottius varieornatus]|uniref:HTH psq-type domain-containing protein n=1 Tax=Ramazzottius varieornatus TaxID=947166 RepID=A0A1D1UVD8_RAMVA|nr:hypothetical protein RvY_04566 [Ramazzottius varieornatus]
MSIRIPAEMYHIPHKTLGNKVNGEHGKKVGRPYTFTLEKKSEICEILIRCSKIGVPLGKRTLIRIVKELALAKGKASLFWARTKDNLRNVLFYDGHSSHLNCVAFLLACLEPEKDIRVVVLPSGQTAFLQPLDKGIRRS